MALIRLLTRLSRRVYEARCDRIIREGEAFESSLEF